MSFKFERLIIRQKAMEFGEEINSFAMTFPNNELYNLSSQIRRAVDSIALNIAEGSIGQSNAETNKFIGYAIRSLAEVVTCLHKAIRRKYCNENTFNKYYLDAYELMNMMIAFRKNLN